MAGRVGALSNNFCWMVCASIVLAGRVGALSRNFCGMVGASKVVAVMVGAKAGAISVESVLV